MRRMGIPRKRAFRATENVNVPETDSGSHTFDDVLHSTAVGTPAKRIALINPLESDEDEPIIFSAPPPLIPEQQNHDVPQSQNLLHNSNIRPSQISQASNILQPSQNPNVPQPSQNLLRQPSQNPKPSSQPRPKPRSTPIVISAPSGCPEFSHVLQQCGFILSTHPSRNYIHLDQLLFRKHLACWIEDKKKEEPQGDNNPAQKFIVSMRTYLSTPANMRHSMTPTQHPGSILQASLLHNLLCISSLQQHVMMVLFPVLADASYSAGNQETVDVLVCILNQIKWLPKIADPESFTKNFLDLVLTATPVAQKEMILYLPEIVPEDKHSHVAEALKKLLDRVTGSVPAIMDCFSSLDIPSDEWVKIREAAVLALFNSPLADYPAFFAFLFRTEDADILCETITSMREKLELTPLGRDAKSDVYLIEIVEKIRFCSSVNPQLVPIWVKQVKDDLEAKEEIKPLDLIMLLIFCEYFKSPYVPLKVMFCDEQHSIQLLDNILENNLAILNQVFSTLVRLCDSFLRGKETKAYPVVEYILVKLFLGLSILESQEIALTLSNLLMDGFPASREASLRVLTEIANQNPAKLLLFAPHLMSVLECVGRFPSNQIRHLMNVLAILSHVPGNKESDMFASEFAILLRKQLTHSSNSTRCFGVIGALATVKQLCHQEDDKHEKAIKELLDLVWAIVKNEEDACLIFFDEFGEIAHLIPVPLVKSFHFLLAGVFQTSWTTTEPKSNKKVQIGKLRLSESFDANKELEDHLFISFEEKAVGMSPLVVPSHLRLVGRLVSAYANGDLSTIDAILGCPVILPDMEMYYKDPKKLKDCSYEQKATLGRYLILGINFFRESVSVFVGQADPELRIKIWLRLSHIVALQQLLVKHFAQFSSLPLAYAAENIGTAAIVGPSTSSTNAPGGRKKPKPGSKKKEVKPVNAGKAKTKTAKTSTKIKKKVDTQIDDDDEEDNTKPLELEMLIQPNAIVPFLRRFDTKVFGILLKSPLNDGSAIDFSTIAPRVASAASPDRQLQDVAKFTPESLVILLTEINQQAKNSKISFNVLDIRGILTSLCSHLDNIAQIYKNQDLTPVDEARFESCFRLLMTTYSLVFESVQKRSEADQADLLHKIVATLIKRLNSPGKTTDGPFPEKLKQIANYFTSFCEVVKHPSTAVEHMMLLKRLDDLCKEYKNVAPYVEKVSKIYMKKKWLLSSAQVDIILKIWLTKSENPLQVMRSITEKLIPNNGKTVTENVPCQVYYQSCSHSNFHTWYSTIVSTLARHVHKHGKKLKGSEDIYQFWNTGILILKDLVLIHQDHELRQNIFLVPLLKYTRLFFEAVSNHGVRKLPSLMTRNAHEAKIYIRNLQSVTRKVQIVCEHSKVQKDTQLLKFVPLLRKVLEILVFRVREALAGCGVASAFDMGFLKHKTLDGDVMNSQPYLIVEDDDESDVDEIDDARGDRNGSDTDSRSVGASEIVSEDMDMDDNLSHEASEFEFPDSEGEEEF